MTVPSPVPAGTEPDVQDLADALVGTGGLSYAGALRAADVALKFLHAAALVRAASPAVSLPGEAEKQVAAVRIALDVESWVIERGAHDRGVQLACARIRAALDDPHSFLDPQPMQAAPSLPGEQP